MIPHRDELLYTGNGRSMDDARNEGVLADCVSGFARAWVQDWCRTFALPSSARFGFGRYGRADAHQLCREWCRRLEYFDQLWLEAGLPPNFEYNQVHGDE